MIILLKILKLIINPLHYQEEDESIIENINQNLNNLNINNIYESQNHENNNLLDNSKSQLDNVINNFINYHKNNNFNLNDFNEEVNNKINQPIKRKNSGIDINDILKKNEFENNMHLYEDLESYIQYLISSYDITLINIKKIKIIKNMI